MLNIPDFKRNLLYVSKSTKQFNRALTFVADFCVMLDLPTKSLIGVGRYWDGLYFSSLCSKKGWLWQSQGQINQSSGIGGQDMLRIKRWSYFNHVWNLLSIVILV